MHRSKAMELPDFAENIFCRDQRQGIYSLKILVFYKNILFTGFQIVKIAASIKLVVPDVTVKNAHSISTLGSIIITGIPRLLVSFSLQSLLSAVKCLRSTPTACSSMILGSYSNCGMVDEGHQFGFMAKK